MSCTKCNDLCQKIKIRTPGELEQAVRTANTALDAGIVIDVSSGVMATPMTDLLQPGWPDIVSADFCCTACGERFHLSCETYHGSGGDWTYGRGPTGDVR